MTATTSASTPVDTKLIAADFATHLQGKLPQSQIDSITSSLRAATNKYPATGSIVSLVFYLQIQVSIKGGETFNGKAGGVSTPGGGALFGDVYTDDLSKLYANTVSFEFQSTPVYFSVLFFDGNSNLLGHFQAGAVSIVSGIGGGKGGWS